MIPKESQSSVPTFAYFGQCFHGAFFVYACVYIYVYVHICVQVPMFLCMYDAETRNQC